MTGPTAPDSLPHNINATTFTRPDSPFLLFAGVSAMRRSTGISCRNLQYRPTQQQRREDIASTIETVLAIIDQDDIGDLRDKGNIVTLVGRLPQ